MTATGDAALVLRPLERGDFSKSYLDLLSQLTTVDRTMTVAELERHFDELFPLELSPRVGLLSCLAPRRTSSIPSPYSIFVIEDTSRREIVATATMFVEKKFIRGCASCGHIEDVVVDGGYRGKQLGKRVIERCIEEAKLRGCYKVILDCSEENAAFYAKCGLERKEIQMVRYL
jgi:glucosamine-phosphate N-acetyltransferase